MPCRSRSGCAECKRRRRKCDETRPACLACKTRDIRCGGYGVNLQWDVGIASRGRFVGAKVPVLAAEKSPSLLGTKKVLTSPNIYPSRRSSSTTVHSEGSVRSVCSPPAFEDGHPTLDRSLKWKAGSQSGEQLGLNADTNLGKPQGRYPATEPSQERPSQIRRSAEDWYDFEQGAQFPVLSPRR